MTNDRNSKFLAILFADIEGYTALMQKDVERATIILRRFQKELEEQVTTHRGTVVNFYGDGALCTFQTPIEAVRCAIRLQNDFKTDPHVPVRVGIHSGTVMQEGDKIFGDSVNLTSRIESMGVVGSVLLSKKVRDDIKNHADLTLQSLGTFHFKNVEESLEVYAVTNEGLVAPKANELKGKFAPSTKQKSPLNYLLPLLFLAVGSLMFWKFYTSSSKNINEPIVYNNSIAFLQLDDLSHTQDQQYLGDAIVTEMISLMGQIPDLKVIGHNSSFYFADKDVSVIDIGKELDVNYLVAGSFSREKEKLKLHLNLLDAATGEIVKPFRTENTLDDIFNVQENLAIKLATQIRLNIKEGFFQKIEHPKKESYLLTNKAWHLSQKDFLENADEIERLLLQSLRIDSTNVMTLERLMVLYRNKYYFDKISYDESRIHIDYYRTKLVEIAPNSQEALITKTMVVELEEKKEILEALLSKESISTPHLSLAGVHLGRLGYLTKGVGIVKRAMELDPLYVYNFSNLAELYFYQEKHSQFFEVIEKMFTAYPEVEKEWYYDISHCYALQKKFKKAKEVALKDENDMWKYRALVIAEYGLGNIKTSNQLLDEYIEKYAEEDAYYIAACYSFRGEVDEAFVWLNDAIGQKSGYLTALIVHPLFKNLHADPRWKPLLKQLGFPEVLAG